LSKASQWEVESLQHAKADEHGICLEKEDGELMTCEEVKKHLGEELPKRGVTR